MTLMNNKILEGKYEIIHEIKQGGFGIVYYGIDINLNKPVAIKEIAPNLLEEPKYLDMFQEEALNIAKLSHNNIVHIYEFNKTQDGRLYIIMEFIDGKDLEKIIRVVRKTNNRIPPHLAIYITAEICMALDYAHHRRDAFTNKPLNLVHQDISPSNIMISRYGGIKLIDFGIATAKKHQSKEKKDNKLRGKVPYMSPEQLIMGNHPDHRSDLFSLGLVLYECLLGERLFNSQEEVINAGKNPKWFKKAIKGKRLPTALERILSKALEIDMSRRYQNANHMYIDLLQYLISCNETGELMDDLSDYINTLFNNGKFHSPGNIINPGARDNPVESSTSYSPIPNAWIPDNSKPKDELIASDPEQDFLSEMNRSTQKKALSTNELSIEDEEELKTVIDVIRISARNHKKRFIQSAFLLLFCVISFGALDTVKGWTKFGIWMYDWLFPPAIEIVTVPPNAAIYIDDREIEGRTPLAIEKISPGVHKLQLEVEGYKPIVKSLFVPREGAIHIQGEAGNNNQRSYLFNFNTEIEINSNPSGATVYLNGIRYNQQTPVTINWEVGDPLSIELTLDGFDRLSGFTLNTKEGFEVVNDRRFWDMTVFNNIYTKYTISGFFKKEILFESIPAGVEIFDYESKSVIGVTGNKIILKAGTHNLELRKNNFIRQKISLDIDKDFNRKVTTVLSRKVRFTAFDELDYSKKDIGANLESLKNGRKEYLRTSRVTPVEIILPAYTYTAMFNKTGYQNSEVRIRPETRIVQVKLERIKAIVQIKVLDALSEQPITDGEIYYNFVDRPEALDIFFDQTNVNGNGFGQLFAGNYNFTVKKLGYNTLNKSINVSPGENETIVFKLYLSN